MQISKRYQEMLRTKPSRTASKTMLSYQDGLQWVQKVLTYFLKATVCSDLVGTGVCLANLRTNTDLSLHTKNITISNTWQLAMPVEISHLCNTPVGCSSTFHGLELAV